MALPLKYKLLDQYVEEMQEYIRIQNKPTRTTTGQATYTNPRTSASYTTVGSAYDGQGEQGLGLLLYNVSPKLSDYIFDDVTYGDVRKSIDGSINQNTVLTYPGGVLTNVKEYWENGTTMKTNATLNYTLGVLTSVVTLQYSKSGTLTNTLTETLVYTDGVLTSVERTVS